MADAGLGSARTSARTSAPATADGGNSPSNVTRLSIPRREVSVSQPGQIGLFLLAADDHASHVWHPCDGVEQHVDALPGVEVASVGNSKGCRGVRGSGAGRHEPRAVGHNRHARAGAESRVVGGGQAVRDGDVAVRAPPHERLAPCQARQFRRARDMRGRYEIRQCRRDLRRVAVGFVDERWTGRQSQDQRRYSQVARHHDVRAPFAGRARQRGHEVFHAPHEVWSADGHPLDDQARARRQAVVRERIARRCLRVRPHHEMHLVASPRQGVTRLHRLDAVRPLEGEPDVGEVENPHEVRVPLQSC